MTQEKNRTDGKPDFDTDRAWERFKRAAAGDPVHSRWTQAGERPDFVRFGRAADRDANQNHQAEEDAIVTKQADAISSVKSITTASAVKAAGAAEWGGTARGRWETEKPWRRRLRRWSAGIAAAAIAGGLLATPLGDRTLAAMVDTFRIRHMVGVGISPDDMVAISDLLERGSPDGDRSFDLAQYGTLTQSGGDTRTIAWEEAEKRLGIPMLRLDSPTAPSFQPATELTFRLNAKAVNRLLARLGSGTLLPAAADGKAIKLRIPDGFASEGTLAGHPARLLQFGKPELTVEDGIDAAVVRDAVLGLPVLPVSLRTKLAAIGDWRSTLPVPARDGVTESLRLGGHEAVMTEGGDRRYLLWLDGDRLGMLSVSAADFTAAAEFRQAAEALVRP